MSNYFRDFSKPVEVIIKRLQQKQNSKVVINNSGSTTGADVPAPYYPDLPEYPCKIVRSEDGKVSELQYGLKSNGSYIWRQLLVRDENGKVVKINQENPDGSFDIVFERDGATGKVNVINID